MACIRRLPPVLWFLAPQERLAVGTPHWVFRLSTPCVRLPSPQSPTMSDVSPADAFRQLGLREQLPGLGRRLRWAVVGWWVQWVAPPHIPDKGVQSG